VNLVQGPIVLLSTCLLIHTTIHTTIHFDIAGVNGQTNVTGGERGDEGGVTLQRQVGAVAAIRVLMLGKVVGVVHHEDGTKEGKDEGEMGGEMPKWAVKYEQLVGARGDEGAVTLQRQVGAVAAIRVMMLEKVVGVVHHEDGTKEGKDEGEMGGEMPKWAVKYEQLVSQVLFQRILDPAMDDGFLRHAYLHFTGSSRSFSILNSETKAFCLRGFFEQREIEREEREREREIERKFQRERERERLKERER
jgi:hypothetical protein